MMLAIHTTADTWVAGVDGCPGGWLVVVRRLGSADGAQARLVATFAEVLALPEQPAIIAVDMPIGLAARTVLGGRPADIAARSRLGPRQSSVFAVPSRAAVMQAEYRAACDAAFATSDPPRKVSKQCFNLFPKIREIDALMTPELQDRVLECHPELSFWALNGEAPLSEPKKVKSRGHPPGLELRRRLLSAAGYAAEFLLDRTAFKASQVGPDDLLDASACAWSAARIARGEGRRFPADPPLDETGLRMEIWG